jgi:hypothetical protein
MDPVVTSMYKAGVFCTTGKPREGYEQYALAIQGLLDRGDAALNDKNKLRGAPSPMLTPRFALHDALHALAAAAAHEELDPREVPGAVPALEEAAVRLSTHDIEGAIIARFGLAWTAYAFEKDREKAAAHYNAIAVLAQQAGRPLTGPYAPSIVATARDNLRQLQLAPGPEKLAHALAMMAGSEPVKAQPVTAPPVAPFVCAGCGRGGAALTCGRCRAVRYCDVNCQRTHWRGGHREACSRKE